MLRYKIPIAILMFVMIIGIKSWEPTLNVEILAILPSIWIVEELEKKRKREADKQ